MRRFEAGYVTGLWVAGLVALLTSILRPHLSGLSVAVGALGFAVGGSLVLLIVWLVDRRSESAKEGESP